MLRALLHCGSVLMLAGAASAADRCELDTVETASKLILVTTPNMKTSVGTLEIFEREPGESWKTTGSPERIVVGYNGLGWAYAFRGKALSDEPLKLEGDKRTPAGIFPL